MLTLRRLRAACWMAALFAVVLPALAGAQEVSPQLAALLKKLPADDAAVRAELLKLSAGDIRGLCGMLVEPGTADDNAARYALHGLTMAAADPDQNAARQTYVKTLAQVLAAEPPPHDRAFLIEQLRLLGDAQVMALLAAQLGAAESCDVAARALVTLGGPAAADALRAALPAAKGASRVAVIEALGALGDAQCVPALLKDAAGTETPLRVAALYALARSGDAQAEAPLTKAAQAESWYERARGTDFLLAYAARLAELKNPGDAARILRELYKTRTTPADTHVRCAALYGLAQALGVKALDDVLAALADENPQLQAAAANVAVTLPGKDVTAAFVAHLGKAAPPVRATLLGVLGRRSDKTALPSVTAALGDSAPAIRLAAIEAVAALGREQAVTPLVTAVAAAKGDERKAIQEALAHIPGDAATAQLKDALSGAAPAVRVVLLDALGARPAAGTLNSIFTAAQDADASVRTAALRALGVLGQASDVPALLKLLIAAQTDDEREAGSQAAAACARQAADREPLAALAVAALDKQNDTTRGALLRVLGRIGGKQAQQVVLAGAADPAAEVKEAAIRALSDWPDDEPAPQVLALAKQIDDTKLHVLALRAYVRLIEINEKRPAAKTLEMCAAGLEIARRADEKKLVLARLRAVHEPESMRMLKTCLADEALRAEASAALLDIVEELLPRYLPELRAGVERVLAEKPSENARERAASMLERIEQYDGLIEDWWVAGPYQQEGKAGPELFDIAFPPELPDAKDVEWRKHPPNRDEWRRWVVDLHQTMSGNNRAAYLFTRIYSPAAQDARLEIGSDDGVKVWLNGQVVHAKNAPRGVGVNDDKAAVKLKEGWNTLLLKVNNGGGDWGACARVRSPEGQALEGVRAAAGEKP